MKILITGASGFIGGHLLGVLIKLYGASSVVAFSSKKIDSVNCIIYENVRSFMLDGYDFSQFTHLIHAGAFIPKNNGEANNIERCNDNVFFTESLLGLGFEKLRRIIYLSTIDVYDGQGVISESSNKEPVSLYGASKFYCERIIKSFAESNNIAWMNLRVGHVYGPGEEKYQKVLPLAFNRVLTGKAVEVWGDGSELRSFIYIDDVVKAIIKSMEYESDNLDVNIVSGSAISIRDLILKVIEISGKDVSLNNFESSHTKRDLVFDNSRLRETLLDQEVSLDVGLKAEFEYMKCMHENSI